MKIFYRYLGAICVTLLFSSCITTQSVPIDQMEPGKVSLPAQVRKVALIARNFKFPIDTLGGYWSLNNRLKMGTSLDNKMIDSIAVTKSLDNLRKAMLESGRFDEVFVYPFNAIKPHVGKKDLPLSSGFIQSVCTESSTEAVISLEMLSFFYSRQNGNPGNGIPGEANAKITAIWSVYTAKSEKPVDRFTHSEVIRWTESDRLNSNKKFKLPGRIDAISIACGKAATNYSKRIVPYWAESSRLLIGLENADFEKAMSYALKNKWKEASRIWESYTKSPGNRVAGIASLNNAIAQEMLGDYDKASFWSDKSVKLLKNGEAGKIARSYAGILFNRQLKAANLNSMLKPAL